MKKILPVLSLAFAASLAVSARSAEVERREINIVIEPAATTLAAEVTLHPGPAGSQYVEARITNRADTDVFLTRVTMTIPWGADFAPGWVLSTGGGCMFYSPTRVHPGVDSAPPSTSFLLARDRGHHTFAGFLTWKTFHTELTHKDGKLVVTTDGEGRRLRARETLALEKIWLTTSDDWQGLLFAYADEIVRENRIVLRPHPAFVGWSNWDYYGSRFTPAQIVSNLDQLMAMKLGANVLQIDGGWANRSGDYLTPKPAFAAGMKPLADEIKRRGLIAGIHLDGMRADHDAQVVREHPDYFLKDQHGAIIGLEAGKKSGRRSRVYFDFSNPEARTYMGRIIHTIRYDWGYDYLKFDFLKFCFPQFIYADTPGISRETTRIVPFNDALTSVERFHLAMSAFREAMGDDAFFIACTAEFGPVYGHVDALRTGGDIDPTYSRFSRACMENGGNFYLHRKVVLNDTDYVVTRGRIDEDDSLTKDPRKTGGDMPFNLAEMWAHYVGLFGGPKLSSDNLNILRDERKALFRRAVNLPACERFVPVDFWQRARDRDDPFAVFLGEAAATTYLAVFNWAADPREFKLEGLTPAQVAGLQKLAGIASVETTDHAFVVRLAGRSSVVFRFAPEAQFDQVRRVLVLQ